MEDNKSQSENKKMQAIYNAMTPEMKAKMDEKMELLKENAKTNPAIAKMLNQK